jgi:hypothetical protein
VRRVTTWSDPVDNKTSFAEVLCENYKALVEKNRKRTGDEDDTSKRPNTRNARREDPSSLATQKEVGKWSTRASGSSQPARMDVDQSAKKVREWAMPTYKLRSDIEHGHLDRPWLGDKRHVDRILQEREVAYQYQSWMEDSSNDESHGGLVWSVPKWEGYDRWHGDWWTLLRTGLCLPYYHSRATICHVIPDGDQGVR